VNTTAIKERPILFSGPMVRAILDGRKTQTRRILKPQPICTANDNWDIRSEGVWKCPYGQPGDRLWVRETWRRHYGSVNYRADHEDGAGHMRWRPSIHMPRWASRITLEITDVRVQQLQDITVTDIYAEGFDPWGDTQTRTADFGDVSHVYEWYASLWDKINGPGAWNANPWAWAITFRRVEGDR